MRFRRNITVLLFCFLTIACSSNEKKESKNFLILQRYLKENFEEIHTNKNIKQYVITPSQSCPYCVHASLSLAESKTWEKTVFITNSPEANCELPHIYCDVKPLLNSLNLERENNPIFFQKNKNGKIVSGIITPQNKDELFEKIIKFDRDKQE